MVPSWRGIQAKTNGIVFAFLLFSEFVSVQKVADSVERR